MRGKIHIDFPDEEYPYDHFPEDDMNDYDYEDEGLDDDGFRDEFPEEGDWEDEEEASIMNGG